jgi:arsenate reductase
MDREIITLQSAKHPASPSLARLQLSLEHRPRHSRITKSQRCKRDSSRRHRVEYHERQCKNSQTFGLFRSLPAVAGDSWAIAKSSQNCNATPGCGTSLPQDKIDHSLKTKVLFICVHNSARSQMAEAWLNHISGEFFVAQSAGLEPGTLNPLVVKAMAEVGIDISTKRPQSVFDVFKSGQLFAYVITVCDEASAERCPVFPGPGRRLHWSFPDPSQLTGTAEEKLAQVRAIRDLIRGKIETWCAEVCPPASSFTILP